MPGFVLTGVAAAVLTAAGLVAVTSPPPAASASASSCPTVQPGDIPVANDIDGDGIADTVVGGRGAVDVRYGGTGRASVLVTSSDLPAADSARSFGDAVAYGDVDNDGCADVLVGEPGANRVVVLYGPVHRSAPRTSVIAEPDPQPGDRFGAAVAVGFGADYTDPRVADVWVGAPDRTVAGHPNAGVLYHFGVDARGRVRLVQTITERSPLIPGTAQDGDHFGAVLSSRLDGVAVGVPDRTVHGKAQAGVLDSLVVSATTGRLIGAQTFSQNSPGVGGSAQAGNRFGAGVAGGGQAVGVPGQRVGSAAHAGAVQTFTQRGVLGTTSYRLVPAAFATQRTAGVPGTAAAGDRFGASVAVGTFTCQEAVQVAVGAPGQDLGTVHDAGSVTVLTISDNGQPARDCPPRLLYRGHGLGGRAQAKTETGQRLSVLADDYGDDEDAIDRLIVASPGATVHGLADAGVVDIWLPRFGTTSHDTTLTRTSGAVANALYGSVLPAP